MRTMPNLYTFRRPSMDDLQAVLHIHRASRTADLGSSSLTEDELRANWQPDKLSLNTDAWLAICNGGKPVAYAEAPQTGRRVWGAFWVLPEERDRGMETYLLRLMEERTLEHANAVNLSNVTLLGRASDSNVVARHAYEQAGYTRYLSFQIMQIDLYQIPPEPNWPEGINVRPFLPGQDEQATYVTDEEASEDKGYHTPLTFDGWAERMGLYAPRFDPTLWFLASSSPDLAGVALNMYDADTSTGWVDHLGVRRPWRKLGLGMALLLHSFREFYLRGIRTVKLSVDSGSLTNAPRLYSHAGMRVVQFYHIYHKELPGNHL